MYTLTLEFAKWQRDQIKNRLTRGLRNTPELKANTEGQIAIWQNICTMACEKHEWETTKTEVDDALGLVYEERTCKHCDAVDNDSYDIAYLQENMTQGCHNCVHQETDGGDSVPYGMGSATLPEHSYCTHEFMEDMSDKEIEDWCTKNYSCPNWQGR